MYQSYKILYAVDSWNIVTLKKGHYCIQALITLKKGIGVLRLIKL